MRTVRLLTVAALALCVAACSEGTQGPKVRRARPARPGPPGLPARRALTEPQVRQVRPVRPGRPDPRVRKACQAPQGAPGSGASVRVVSATCDAASCVVACNKGEILLMAYCGRRKTPAVFPTPDSASCHRHEPASNPLIAACASSASVSTVAAPTPAPVSHAAAGDIPKLDIAQTCRAATDTGAPPTRTAWGTRIARVSNSPTSGDSSRRWTRSIAHNCRA